MAKNLASFELPVEVFSPDASVQHVSVSVVAKKHPFEDRHEIVIYTDAIPHEFNLTIVDGRGASHPVWCQENYSRESN